MQLEMSHEENRDSSVLFELLGNRCEPVNNLFVENRHENDENQDNDDPYNPSCNKRGISITRL